jgi:hypothetical protein
MDINLNLSFATIKKSIAAILHRYHLVLFVVVILGGLAVVIFFLNNILIRSSESDGYTSNTNNLTFDETTIDRIKQLKTSNQTESQLDLNGRSNPFVE